MTPSPGGVASTAHLFEHCWLKSHPQTAPRPSSSRFQFKSSSGDIAFCMEDGCVRKLGFVVDGIARPCGMFPAGDSST